MFERCDAGTRLVLGRALQESRARGHTWLGTEHVLLAVVLERGRLPEAVAAVLADADAIAMALPDPLGPGGRDTDHLEAIGVDLERVRSAVRQTFGDEAVQRLRRPVHQPWQPWRRPSRRCRSLLSGEVRMTPRLKESFEGARRHAERRQRPDIDPASVLLGILDVEEAVANRVLRDAGVDLDALRLALGRSGA